MLQASRVYGRLLLGRVQPLWKHAADHNGSAYRDRIWLPLMQVVDGAAQPGVKRYLGRRTRKKEIRGPSHGALQSVGKNQPDDRRGGVFVPGKFPDTRRSHLVGARRRHRLKCRIAW